MPVLRARLIDAAVRPFSDNAEMKLSASKLLENLPLDDEGAESAIRRWDLIDSRRRKSVVSTALFIILALVSAAVLTVSIREVIGYQKIFGWFRGDFTGDFPNPEELIGKDLTSDQKLLLFGDSSASSGDMRAKALWDSEPENPAYFAEYVAVYQNEFGKLPDDFLSTARRLDPDNAWFTYLAAAAVAKNSCEDRTQTPSADGTVAPLTWKISEPAKFDSAIALLQEARGQPRCQNYQSQMLQKRIPLLPQQDLLENLNSIYAINCLRVSDNIRVSMLTHAICARGWQLGENADTAALVMFLADSNLFLRRMMDLEAPSLLDTVVFFGSARITMNHLIPAAEKAGLSADAERMTEIRQRLDQLRESAKTAEFLIAGRSPVETGGTFVGSHLTGSKIVANHPPVTDDDLKPGRLTEHALMAQLGSLATWFLLLVALALVAVYRFRSPALIRRCAGRMAPLLQRSDWCWIVLAGIVLPFCYFIVITRLTALGGRDFSITRNDLKLIPDTVISLPLVQYLGLAFLLVVVPLLVARWRLGLRGAAFGFATGRSWPGLAAAVAAGAFVPVIGWGVTAGNVAHVRTAFVLLAIPASWLLVVGIRALIAGPVGLFHSSSAARVLVPAYAAAMLLTIPMVPVFKADERRWFKQDNLMRFDPAQPALFRYEYEMSQQARRELRQAMGFEK